MISKIADEVRELLAGKLRSARRVSITTDAWTSKLCNNAYLGMYKFDKKYLIMFQHFYF